MTDPTELALLRSIVAHPHEDTPRLAYADWLDEHDRHERAEFVRVQVRMARTLYSDAPITDGLRGFVRERELLAHAREWARVPCPQCECKGGWEDAVAYYRCGHCKGTGDAMQREGCAPHFCRGFVSRVEVPSLSWVCERVSVACEPCEGTGHDGTNEYHSVGVGACQRCEGMGTRTEWRVTPWALAVASAHPVTEFGIGGLEPLTGGGVWRFDDRELPPELTALLPQVWFDTREQALSALATAAADWVRAAVLAAWAKEGRP